jgi:hypothetical protein
MRSLISHETNFKILKSYEPIVLEDITKILESKVDLIETLMRFYDLLNLAESKIPKEIANQKKLKQMVKEISLGKQKLIFYMSYVKSKH